MQNVGEGRVIWDTFSQFSLRRQCENWNHYFFVWQSVTSTWKAEYSGWRCVLAILAETKNHPEIKYCSSVILVTKVLLSVLQTPNLDPEIVMAYSECLVMNRALSFYFFMYFTRYISGYKAWLLAGNRQYWFMSYCHWWLIFHRINHLKAQIPFEVKKSIGKTLVGPMIFRDRWNGQNSRNIPCETKLDISNRNVILWV